MPAALISLSLSLSNCHLQISKAHKHFSILSLPTLTTISLSLSINMSVGKLSSGSGDRKTISVKLMIDKRRDRVIFAESDSDFIDTLFSILTLPIGTVVKLLGSGSTEIGSIVLIYNSVVSLEQRHFRSVFCREMLCRPRNASEAQCSKLKLRFDPSSEPVKFYSCGVWNCSDQSRLSTFGNARCRKGHEMDVQMDINDGYGSNSGDSEDDDDGVFVKGGPGDGEDHHDGVFVKGSPARFMITDDLQVMSGSTASCISLLRKLGINDGSEVEERTIEIGQREVFLLLKFSLLSKSPLTEALLPNHGTGVKDAVRFEPKKAAQDKKATATNSKSISLKLIVSKSQKRVLYAEAGVDVVDFLLGFLTFPLGSAVQLLGRNSSLGCIDELYKSAENLSKANYIKSDECKKMLLSPKLAPYFSFENQPLHVEEASHPDLFKTRNSRYLTTFSNAESESSAMDSSNEKRCIIMDPKSPIGKPCSGNGFVKGPAVFMIRDSLTVTPLSPISSVAILNRLNVPLNDVEERAVTMGKDEALNLLKASLISKTALSDVFYRREPYPEVMLKV